MVIPTFAADYEKVTVTAETAKVYEKSSTKSDVWGEVEEGYKFTPTDETGKFWKLKYKNDDGEKVTGYIRKKDTTDGSAATANAKIEAKSEVTIKSEGSWSTESSRAITDTVYWVKNGKSYHLTENCTTLTRTKKTYSGSFESCHKRAPCNVCAGRRGYDR